MLQVSLQQVAVQLEHLILAGRELEQTDRRDWRTVALDPDQGFVANQFLLRGTKNRLVHRLEIVAEDNVRVNRIMHAPAFAPRESDYAAHEQDPSFEVW